MMGPVRGTPQRPGGAARASALSDLALGAVTLAEACRLARSPAADPAWAAVFGWVGAGAIAGAVHHGWSRRIPGWSTVGWLLAAGLTALLRATARETGAPDRPVRALATAGLAGYGALVGAGRRGLDALVRAQSAGMAVTVALWLRASRAGHPRARPVLCAMAASVSAAAVRRLVPERIAGRRVDRDTLYHLAQIPGVLMLSRAVRAPR
jgi:hypothetical protein